MQFPRSGRPRAGRHTILIQHTAQTSPRVGVWACRVLEADRGGSSLTYRPSPPMPLLPFVSPDTSLKHHRFAAGDVVLFFAGRPKIAGARGAKNNATITDALFPSAKDAGRLPDEGERPGESKRRV